MVGQNVVAGRLGRGLSCGVLLSEFARLESAAHFHFRFPFRLRPNAACLFAAMSHAGNGDSPAVA